MRQIGGFTCLAELTTRNAARVAMVVGHNANIFDPEELARFERRVSDEALARLCVAIGAFRPIPTLYAVARELVVPR